MLKRGGVVIYPTETFYGLGADPFSTAALLRVYEIKERLLDKPLPLIASDVAAVRRITVGWNMSVELLVRAFWPGPLTLILTAAPALPSLIHAGSGKIAVRVSSHPVAGALAAAVGGVLTATSANIAGSKPVKNPERIPRDLLSRVDGVLSSGRLPGNLPSTILDVSDPTPRVVRKGCLPIEKIVRTLEGPTTR